MASNARRAAMRASRVLNAFSASLRIRGLSSSWRSSARDSAASIRSSFVQPRLRFIVHLAPPSPLLALRPAFVPLVGLVDLLLTITIPPLRSEGGKREDALLGVLVLEPPAHLEHAVLGREAEADRRWSTARMHRARLVV